MRFLPVVHGVSARPCRGLVLPRGTVVLTGTPAGTAIEAPQGIDKLRLFLLGNLSTGRARLAYAAHCVRNRREMGFLSPGDIVDAHLGTTNSGVARWDAAGGQPVLVELPAVCRIPEGEDVLEAPRLVPSAVHMVEHPRWLDRLGALPPLASTFFVGRTAYIGRQALERNRTTVHVAFTPG